MITNGIFMSGGEIKGRCRMLINLFIMGHVQLGQIRRCLREMYQ
jgi:hypothetical protein